MMDADSISDAWLSPWDGLPVNRKTRAEGPPPPLPVSDGGSVVMGGYPDRKKLAKWLEDFRAYLAR